MKQSGLSGSQTFVVRSFNDVPAVDGTGVVIGVVGPSDGAHVALPGGDVGVSDSGKNWRDEICRVTIIDRGPAVRLRGVRQNAAEKSFAAGERRDGRDAVEDGGGRR